MNTFVGILLLAAVVAVIIFVQKIIGTTLNAVSKSANKNILYRSEFREGQELVSESLSFETSAPIDQVMAALKSAVAVAQIRSVVPALYESSRTANRVTYAFGSSMTPKHFEAEVELSEHDGTTQGQFDILSWKENDGMVAALASMKKLRRQVRAGFTAADSDVKIQTISSHAG